MPKTILGEDDWLTRKQAATYAPVSMSTIDRAIKTKKLRHIRVGRRVFTTKAWMDAWLTANLIPLLLALMCAYDACKLFHRITGIRCPLP